MDRPDINGREAILKIHSKNVLLARNVDLRKLAGRTPGFVGADLANLVNEAALLAARKDKKKVGAADFDEAIDRVVGGLQKKNRVINSQEKEIVAFHDFLLLDVFFFFWILLRVLAVCSGVGLD